jgi:hypothetical protein
VDLNGGPETIKAVHSGAVLTRRSATRVRPLSSGHIREQLGQVSASSAYNQVVKQIWTGPMAQAAAKYGDNAPMAAVCCNACRACVTSNLVGVALAGVAGAASLMRRLVR